MKRGMLQLVILQPDLPTYAALPDVLQRNPFFNHFWLRLDLLRTQSPDSLLTAGCNKSARRGRLPSRLPEQSLLAMTHLLGVVPTALQADSLTGQPLGPGLASGRGTCSRSPGPGQVVKHGPTIGPPVVPTSRLRRVTCLASPLRTLLAETGMSKVALCHQQDHLPLSSQPSLKTDGQCNCTCGPECYHL